MPFADDSTRAAYTAAWDAWQKQLAHLHRVFLDGEPVQPDQLKGLLNRESRAKDRYEEARRSLLGISSATPAAPGENPFR